MTDRTLRVLADAALECGLEAGAFLLAGRDRVLEVATKSTPTDVVTDMDRASERMLVERILARFPTDGLLGEEGAGQVAAFLARNAAFRPEKDLFMAGRYEGPGKLLSPAHDGTDGFFVARFERLC